MDLLVYAACLFVAQAVAQPHHQKRVLLHGEAVDMLNMMHGFQSSLASYNVKLQAASKTIEALSAGLVVASNERAALNGSFVAAINERAALSASLTAAKMEIANLKVTVQSAEQKIAGLQSDLLAESHDRCQTGTVYFGPLHCASGSCSLVSAVSFNPVFRQVPHVSVSTRNLDVDSDHNIRYYTNAINIHGGGATVTVATWADTIIYSSSFSWIACPA